MALLDNLFKKKDPIPKNEWKAFCKKVDSIDRPALDKLGIDSLNKLDHIPMNLLHITDFSSEKLQWLEPIKAAILNDSEVGWHLNRILFTRFNSRYNSTAFTFGDMAWWWLCTNYSLIDQVTSTIHRENVHEFMLCSTCIYVADDLHEINYYMAPDIVKTGRDEIYLGYSLRDIEYEASFIRFIWDDIALSFSDKGRSAEGLKYFYEVHALITKTRTGFGWRW